MNYWILSVLLDAQANVGGQAPFRGLGVSHFPSATSSTSRISPT